MVRGRGKGKGRGNGKIHFHPSSRRIKNNHRIHHRTPSLEIERFRQRIRRHIAKYSIPDPQVQRGLELACLHTRMRWETTRTNLIKYDRRIVHARKTLTLFYKILEKQRLSKSDVETLNNPLTQKMWPSGKSVNNAIHQANLTIIRNESRTQLLRRELIRIHLHPPLFFKKQFTSGANAMWAEFYPIVIS